MSVTIEGIKESVDLLRSEVAQWRKEMQDDLRAVNHRIDDASGVVNVMRIDAAKSEQRISDLKETLDHHREYQQETYRRLGSLEKDVEIAQSRITAMQREAEQVNKATEQSNGFWRWIIPHLWQIAIAIGGLTAGVGYLLDKLRK